MARFPFKKTLLQAGLGAGDVLLRYFGKVRHVRTKENPSSVVCEADLNAEKHVIAAIRREHPDDNIISEESGADQRKAEYTWIIDPLDGTSNFVAGVPWFGVQVAVLRECTPVAAMMYLPIFGDMYYAEAGKGAWKNGKRLHVSPERDLKNTLCAFSMDSSSTRASRRAVADMLVRVATKVRNTRATNSLVDFCYTIEGKFGSCINFNCKIWDIAPVALMLPEAGGKFTALDGTAIEFCLGIKNIFHSYEILGGTKLLYPELFRAVRERHR